MRDASAGRRLMAEDGTPLVVTAMFPRVAESVPAARRFVHAALLNWKLPDLADAAELVASELASNAVLHARCPTFRVNLRRLGDDRVRIAVIDRSPALPKVADPGDDEGHGRGLALVEAFSQQWGTDPLEWGKRVWADLETPVAEQPPVRMVPMHTGRWAQAVYMLMVLTVAAALIVATLIHP